MRSVISLLARGPAVGQRSVSGRRCVDELVDLALGYAGQPGHLRDRVLRVLPAASRSATAASRLAGSSSTAARGGAPWTTSVTSPRTPSAAQATRSAKGPAADLLVGLGQPAAHGRGAVAAERLGQRGERGLGAVRRLEEHQRALLVGEVGQPSAALARLARQEPSKQKRSTGSPLTARAVSTADGPGTAVTVTSCSTAAATRR